MVIFRVKVLRTLPEGNPYWQIPIKFSLSEATKWHNCIYIYNHQYPIYILIYHIILLYYIISYCIINQVLLNWPEGIIYSTQYINQPLSIWINQSFNNHTNVSNHYQPNIYHLFSNDDHLINPIFVISISIYIYV